MFLPRLVAASMLTATFAGTSPCTCKVSSTMGCYDDFKNSSIRLLPYAAGKSMTQEACGVLCVDAGFRLAGVEYSGQCFCGFALNPAYPPTPRPAADCEATRCPGNASQPCGGAARILVFKPSCTGECTKNRTGACADGVMRRVRYWVEWLPRHLEQNSSGCNASFLGNISKYLHAIDSLAPAAWTLGTNGSLPTVVDMADMGGQPVDEHFWSCMEQLHSLFSPNLTLGAIGNLPQSCPGAAAAGNHPEEFAASMARWLQKHPQVQEIWTDFEGWDVSHLNPNQTKGLFGVGYELLTQLRPTFVYGWGSHVENMSCAKLHGMAPHVMIQDPDTYWDNTMGNGWYGGFNKLLAQDAFECSDALGKGLLSVGICPDCPDSGNNFDAITMDDLYDRMDAICHAGIKDISGFEFNEILKRHDHPQDGDQGLGQRYMEAFAYFRTGQKGLIRKLLAEQASHAVSQQLSSAVVTRANAERVPPKTMCRNHANRTLATSQCFDQDGNVCTAATAFNPAKGSLANCVSLGFPCVCCGNEKGSQCTGEGGRNGCICNTVELPWAHIYARCSGCDQQLYV